MEHIKLEDKKYLLRILTERHLEIINKRITKQQLTITEKSIFYKVIKPKLKGVLLAHETAKRVILN